ncbi:MAG: OadG family protein [Clostridia bacterium]|nr:OadG family protein [Clostridia bacterium]
MNAVLSANQYISSSGIVTVYLLAIVFLVLAFLVVVLSMGHRVMQAVTDSVKNRKKKGKDKEEALPSAPAAPALPQGEDEEEAAAVMAAISVILEREAPQKKAKFVVRKIERVR